MEPPPRQSPKGVIPRQLAACQYVGAVLIAVWRLLLSKHMDTVARRVVLLLLLSAVCRSAVALDTALDASQYAHTSWKIREGFVKGAISSIAQTPDGYLWLGTDFGLLRFDGVRNVPWEPPPDQHLPSNQIFSVLSTRDGTLWIGTLKGLASWKGGKLTQYPEFAGKIIFKLFEDREGSVWV